VLSIGALIGWWITTDPNTALAPSNLADNCAAVPTVVKCYRHPETEDRTVYALMAPSAVLALVTLPARTFTTAGFSCYLPTLCGTLLILLCRPSGPSRLGTLPRWPSVAPIPRPRAGTLLRGKDGTAGQ
jgi:hypothetical protein